jgi:hypothetical protein
VNRRNLLSAAALVLPQTLFARAEKTIREEDAKTLQAIRAIPGATGIELGEGFRTTHYLVLSEPTDTYKAKIGKFCEALLVDAMDVFSRAGLPVRPLERRLTVVIMEQEPFGRLAIMQGSPEANAYYDRALRTCFVPLNHVRDDPRRPIDWGHTLINLGHELMHQFCYNAGLLNPEVGAPAFVSEGLAMLGEVSSWDQPRLLRQNNLIRLERLAEAETRGLTQLADLFQDDGHFRGNHHTRENHLDSYSWAWLFIYTLLTEEDLRPKFRAYLKKIATRTDKTHRVEDARAHFGDLDAFQTRLLRRSHNLRERPPSKYTSQRRIS